jgi:hypothetical protein
MQSENLDRSHYAYQVFQIPLDVILTTFPEIKPIWETYHGMWHDIKGDPRYLEPFTDGAADPLARELLQEASKFPDIEKYTTIERDGIAKYFPDSDYVYSSFIDRDWVLNRGKIARYTLPRRDDFDVQGVFWYPKNGYREWHSNYNYITRKQATELRMYLIDVDEEEQSSFFYLDKDGKLLERKDHAKMVNIFMFPANQKFWHSVVSNTNRFSIGIRPNEEQTLKLLELIKPLSK